MKVPTKYKELLFATLTSVVMSFIITFIITLVDVGLSEAFWKLWVQGFVVSSAMSVPVSFVVIPLVRRFVDKLTAPEA